MASINRESYNIFGNDIPIESTSFQDDQKILNYCNNNKSDERCKCIIPEDGIHKLQINTFNPYYCWYSPCNNKKCFKTSIILEEQKKCNIVLCHVELGQVSLDDNGKLSVKNNCISSKNFSDTTISQELLEHSLREDYILPNYFSRTFFPLLSALGLILFLKL